MAEPARVSRPQRIGVAEPRIAPPIPANSLVAPYEAAAKTLGIKLYPWQRIAARYLMAQLEDHWLYREVAIVVARQNGKTELIIPRILMGLERGEQILHTAQNRDIPRKTFVRQIVPAIDRADLGYRIRMANGQEEITAPNGGRYKIVAPNAASRGETADLVLIDEVRQQHDLELMDAMLPTTAARPGSQIIYLSNAGDSDSVVLNDLRRRGVEGTEPRFAYLEWSAAPERALDDRDGWAEANPALGHGQVTEETLEHFFAGRPGPSFETEHLCRWVISMQPRAVEIHRWQNLRATLEKPTRPVLGVSMDISGQRASAVMAWQQSDGTIALKVIADVHGDPIDTERFGTDLKGVAARLGIRKAAYDTLTDTDIARHLRNAKPMIGREFASASENFVRSVYASRLRWDENGDLTDDLEWTARKPYSEGGAFMLNKVQADRPVTAVLAAVRAVWLASAPKTEPRVL